MREMERGIWLRLEEMSAKLKKYWAKICEESSDRRKADRVVD